jgi:hypothetical protein
MSATLALAGARGAERIVALGVLGLRVLRYVAQDRPFAGPLMDGLRVEAVGAAERAGWHATTGIYGFLRLPPGPRRLLVTDPAGRFQPAAFDVTVPDRSTVRLRLEQGVPEPDMAPRALLRDVALHGAPTAPIPPGLSVVTGQVRDAAGRGVSLARLMLTTNLDGALRRQVTWSAPDGAFAFRLPGERPDTIGGDPPWRVTRALVAHVPRAPLAAALARDLLAALPAERDAIDPDAGGSPFERRGFLLRHPDGTTRTGVPGSDPTLPILGGQSSRWDIELA